MEIAAKVVEKEQKVDVKLASQGRRKDEPRGHVEDIPRGLAEDSLIKISKEETVSKTSTIAKVSSSSSKLSEGIAAVDDAVAALSALPAPPSHTPHQVLKSEIVNDDKGEENVDAVSSESTQSSPCVPNNEPPLEVVKPADAEPMAECVI